MKPPNRSLPDPYPQHRHYQTSQLYSYFPTQNPNPYPLHNQRLLPIESQFSSAVIDHNTPGADAYYSSYPVTHVIAGDNYNAHHGSSLTYAHTIGTAPPPAHTTNTLLHNWNSEEAVLQYGSTLYADGATVPQDASQPLLTAIPTPNIWNTPISTIQPRIQWKKIPKKPKIAQPAWCEVCKLACNSTDVLNNHRVGKKHLRNVEILHKVASVATTSTSAHINPPLASKPIIGPTENPKKGNLGIKKKVETPKDLEIKRRKVLEGGAAANSVRTCQICNVVCNSDTVFRFHLAGQKHLSMSQNINNNKVV